MVLIEVEAEKVVLLLARPVLAGEGRFQGGRVAGAYVRVMLLQT